MQICVLSDAGLSAIAEWQKSIDAEGFPLRLDYDKPLAEVQGFLPANLNGIRTGFECHHVKPSYVIDTYPEINFDHAWRYVLAFIWIGDFNEMRAAWMAATAYALATAGVVFDENAGQLLTGPQAAQAVRQIERDMPKLEAKLLKMKEQR
jgi:hypothetical protein